MIERRIAIGKLNARVRRGKLASARELKRTIEKKKKKKNPATRHSRHQEEFAFEKKCVLYA